MQYVIVEYIVVPMYRDTGYILNMMFMLPSVGQRERQRPHEADVSSWLIRLRPKASKLPVWSALYQRCDVLIVGSLGSDPKRKGTTATSADEQD